MQKLNTKTSFDNKLVHSNIFKTLKVPERRQRLANLNKGVINLNKVINLLEVNLNKKNNQKKINHSLDPTSKLTRLKINEEQKLKKFISLENLISQKANTNSESLTISNSKRSRNVLFMDRYSSLKRKNQIILNKLNSNDNNNIKKSLYGKLFNTNNNENITSEFNLSKSKNLTRNNNILRKINTESTNFYENKINSKRNLNELTERNISSIKILPPIKIKKENLIIDNKYSTISTKVLNESKNFNDSLSSNISKNSEKNIKDEEKEENQNNLDYLKKNYIRIKPQTDRSYSSSIKNISKTNNNIIKFLAENPSLSSNSQVVKNYNKNIKTIKNSRYKYDIDNWVMKLKFKYANWKYGIEDVQKYFIDLKDIGKDEEKELERRRSFFEKVELMVKNLNEEQERKKYMNVYKKYGINVNDQKKNLKENEFWVNELNDKKMRELNKELKLTEQRKIKEKENRKKLKNILKKYREGFDNIS